MKIMIVDDEIVSRMKMQKILNSVGECEAFESGVESLEAFWQALENGVPFNVLTLDITMPEMDGTEILRRIRQIEAEMKVPKEKQAKILMVTSQVDEGTVMTCIKAGCDEYIGKPFDKGLILDKFMKMGLLDTEKYLIAQFDSSGKSSSSPGK